MPRRRMEMEDRLFRYKAQLEANTNREWSWSDVADGMKMDDKTLRAVRYHPEKVNVATLRRVADFFESYDVRFSVSQFLASLETRTDSVPQSA